MLEIALFILVVGLLAISLQEIRYFRIRRNRAQDYQKVFHSGDAFHVITFFRLRDGDKLVETANRFLQQICAEDKVRLIYAGQAAFTMNSQQLDKRDWDGVLLLEYAARSIYQQSCEEQLVGARLLFADSYQHGMRRDRKVGLSMPRFLLGVRLKDLLRGNWTMEPFQTAAEFETYPELQAWRNRANRVRALHEINRQGLVVFNLVKRPAAGYEAGADEVGGRLLSRMAALSHGPLHIGRSVALEKSASFNRVYILYYPSARYYADMLSSQFYFNIGGYRQLGDAIRVPTVPITARLLE